VVASRLKVDVPADLLAFIEQKVEDLRRAAPFDRRDEITPESVLLGYAEIGRRHDAAARARVRQIVRERGA
jgi:hypothetical protein